MLTFNNIHMISSITEFSVTSLSGVTTIDGSEVYITVTPITISGNVQLSTSPGEYFSVTLNKETGKSSVSFSAEDTTSALALVEPLTAKLVAIKAELAN